MKKAAIFDLDGTLVTTIGLHEQAWQEMFNGYDITLDAKELKEQSGNKNTAFIKLILERRERHDLNPQQLSDEKDALVIKILEHEPAKIYPGVKEFLELLQANGIRSALATSATRQTAVLLGKELMPYFEAKIFAEDVGIAKPNPEIFFKAASALGLEPHDCIVFEDAARGVEAAKAGGFFCVARDNGFGQDLSRADVIVNEYHPQELLQYFL